jgi:1-acyl-sn-glycerol-3-phosphate acyltransferase
MKYKRPKIFRFLTVLILRIYILIFLKFKVNRKNRLPKGAKIFAINHPTTTDPFLIYCLFPNAKVLIDKDIFNIKILGWVFNRLGHIPVDGKNGMLAYNEAKDSLNKGDDIIIFPEGINDNKSIHKVENFKTGVIRLALETNIPIVPIGVHIEEKGIKSYITKSVGKEKSNTRWYMFGKYTVNIGKGIRLKGSVNNREDVRKKARYLQDEIQKLSRK